MTKIEMYIDELLKNDLDHSHWFMTKQTMTNYYFPFFIAKIVESFPTDHLDHQSFNQYYTYCFKNDQEASILFPKQTESENTYRNAIICEFLGLIQREKRTYDSAHPTDAYHTLKKYIHCNDDIANNRDVVDRQIEKICLNVITSASKYPEVKDVTIFPVIFLYKVLLGLQEKYYDSKLNYDEFSIFVMRTKKYDDYDNIMSLIEEYRQHNYSKDYDAKIAGIMKHASTLNVRFDTLFGSLSTLEYENNKSYSISSTDGSYEKIKSIVNMYEQSDIAKENNKEILKKFMQSSAYFKGKIDDVDFSNTLSIEDIQNLIKQDDEYFAEVDRLAEKYGLSGNTIVTHKARLAQIQQGLRTKLIEQHSQKCVLCNIKNLDLLIASHIKDSSECNIYEKANPNNALLLCANHDKLFDKHLISFDFTDGHIMVSDSLTEEEKKLCNIDENYVLPSELLNEERSDFLMIHNEVFYKKEYETDE